MKYITTRDPDGKEEIFIFPRSIHHDAMAESLCRIRNKTSGNWRRIFREPISAGFVSADGQCFGHSETLKLISRPEDSLLLSRQYG